VLPQASVFSMGMQVQAVVGSDRTFARVNVTPFGVSMPDPSTTTFLTIPGPNLGIFDGGFQQPAFISQKPLVLPFQGGQQSLFGPSIFAAQSISMGAPGLSQANPFLFRSNQFSVMSMQSTFPVTSPFLQPGPWPYMNPYQAMWLQASRMNAGPRARIR
jgi:hypothetical protein